MSLSLEQHRERGEGWRRRKKGGGWSNEVQEREVEVEKKVEH